MSAFTPLLPIEQKLLDEYGAGRGDVALRLWRQFYRDDPVRLGEGNATWDGLDKAVGAMASDMYGDYVPWSDSADMPDLRPSETLWLDNLRSDMTSMALEAAVLAAIRELLQQLPSAPDSLRTHPGAEQLRADLARLISSR